MADEPLIVEDWEGDDEVDEDVQGGKLHTITSNLELQLHRLASPVCVNALHKSDAFAYLKIIQSDVASL
ncbi:MAG: hypothetical protein ABIS30_03890 [Gallionella sp.]